MKVRILVEFVVEGTDDEVVAKSAASLAAWNNLVLTENGQDVVERVAQHVDGHGEYEVLVSDDHE